VLSGSGGGDIAAIIHPITAASSKQRLSDLPASLQALPALNALICRAWQQRSLQRPTAGELHAQLQALINP
jgi:hypothetical protein